MVWDNDGIAPNKADSDEDCNGDDEVGNGGGYDDAYGGGYD